VRGSGSATSLFCPLFCRLSDFFPITPLDTAAEAEAVLARQESALPLPGRGSLPAQPAAGIIPTVLREKGSRAVQSPRAQRTLAHYRQSSRPGVYKAEDIENT
jgi:hypothetical protein